MSGREEDGERCIKTKRECGMEGGREGGREGLYTARINLNGEGQVLCTLAKDWGLLWIGWVG
jgi:hypothetical protein